MKTDCIVIGGGAAGMFSAGIAASAGLRVLLVEKNDKLGKILFPAHRKASSLYKRLGGTYYDYLDSKDVKKKIKLSGWHK